MSHLLKKMRGELKRLTAQIDVELREARQEKAPARKVQVRATKARGSRK